MAGLTCVRGWDALCLVLESIVFSLGSMGLGGPEHSRPRGHMCMCECVSAYVCVCGHVYMCGYVCS